MATEEQRARDRKRYAANKEKIKQRRKAYYAANTDRVKFRQRSYRGANRDKTIKRRKAYYAANRPHIEFKVRVRRQLLSSVNELLPGEWAAVVEQCNNRCIVPGCGASPVTKDHVVPLSKGGRHHISNLQPLCKHHNDSKGTKSTDYRVGR